MTKKHVSILVKRCQIQWTKYIKRICHFWQLEFSTNAHIPTIIYHYWQSRLIRKAVFGNITSGICGKQQMADNLDPDVRHLVKYRWTRTIIFFHPIHFSRVLFFFFTKMLMGFSDSITEMSFSPLLGEKKVFHHSDFYNLNTLKNRAHSSFYWNLIYSMRNWWRQRWQNMLWYGGDESSRWVRKVPACTSALQR